MDETRKKEYKYSITLIVVITFLLFGNTLWNNYSGDDSVFITDNSITMSGLKRAGEILTDDGILKGWIENDKTTVEENGLRKRYRPLTQLTFATEVQIFGANPHISHFFNILFYCFTVVLIYIIFSRLSVNFYQGKWLLSFPFLLAVLFMAHPVHTEVVANIKSRDEILALLFSLLSLYFTLKYLESYKLKFLCISFLTFFLALLSKENAITFLAIIPLTVYFFSTNIQKENRSKLLSYGLIMLPLVLSTAIFLIVRGNIVGPYNPVWGKSIFNNYFVDCNLSQKYGVIFYSIGKYIQLLIFPFRLMCDYSIYEIPVINVTNMLSLGSICICILLVIYALIRIKSRSLLSFGILFYFATFSIYSNIIYSTGTAVAERFLFIPSLGFCIIVSYYLSIFIPTHFKNNYYRLLIPGVLTIVILSLYSFRTVTRNTVWKDWKTLFKADLDRPNNCARLNEVYAELYFNGQNDESPDFIDKVKTAKKYYQRAIDIYPGYVDALNLLAVCYYKIDRNYDSAVYYYLQSLRKDNSQLQVYKNIVNMADKKNDNAFSLKIFKELVKLNPIQPILNYRLGKSFLKNNEPDSAVFFMEKAVSVNYKYTQAVDDLIAIYKAQDIKLKGNYKTYIRLAELYEMGKKDTAKTVYYLEKAINKDPGQPVAFYSLGILYYSGGNKAKAIEALKTASKLAPDNLDIIRYLQNIYKELGDKANFDKYSKILNSFNQ